MIKNEVKEVIEGLVSGLNLQSDTNSPKLNVEDIFFARNEVYDTTNMYVWAFRNRGDYRYDNTNKKIVLDLGNMVNESVVVNGIQFANSECAYIAGIYSSGDTNSNQVQMALSKHRNGLFAKKMFRYRVNEYCQLKRTDWQDFNVEWMKYVIKCKIETNPQFRKLLLSIPNNVMIVEDVSFQSAASASRLFWGSENLDLKRVKKDLLKKLKKVLIEMGIKYRKDYGKYLYNSIFNLGSYQGVNTMGKILTYLMICIKEGIEPEIDYKLLNEKEIWWFGKKLMF